jgi:adenylate cyclase
MQQPGAGRSGMNPDTVALRPAQLVVPLLVVMPLANAIPVLCYKLFIAPLMGIAHLYEGMTVKQPLAIPRGASIPASIVLVVIILVPMFLVYIRPILRSPTSPAAGRRLLNIPVMVGLMNVGGWFVGCLMAILQDTVNCTFVSAAAYVRHTAALGVNVFLMAGLCFVIHYYVLDFINRKYYIPRFFPDGDLSRCAGAVNLSIRSKFFLHLFAVAVYPLFILASAMQMNPDIANQFTLVLAVITGFILLGTLLTYLQSRTYQKPLVEMKTAAQRIRTGDYDIRVAVTSSDEIGNLGEAINRMADGLKEKEFIKDTFGRMVDPKVRDHLLRGNINLGGELRTATILFSDIRGFTPLSERLPPEQTMALLNRYFERMSRCVADHQGLVNKYLGDGMMAVFGAPVETEHHADAAVRAAIAMAGMQGRLNQEFRQDGWPEIQTGIGIHTGPVVAGNTGAQSRMEYTVIGDAVNTASRIEGLTKQYQASVIISEATLRALEDPAAYPHRSLGQARITGKREPITVYEILVALGSNGPPVAANKGTNEP